MTRYLARVADRLVDDALSYSGGILLEGVRACGKTMTGRVHASSEIALDSGLPQVRAAMDVNPGLLLDGAVPRLIDEWQIEPSLWNIARREIDRRQSPGQFILTGSSVPAEDASRHSGAHRITRVRMRPMTLVERGRGAGTVSLKSLFAGEEPAADLDPGGGLQEALDDLVHGGWPADIPLTTQQAQRHLRDYVHDVITIDVGRLDGEPRRDPVRMAALLRSLARHVGTEASYATIAADTASASLTAETAVAYVSALQRLFLIEPQPAWRPHLRSRYAVRTSPKIHLVDPALAAALTGASTARLMQDLQTAGQWFESQAVMHLQVFAEALGGQVYHYRDKSGREADAVVELPDGRWGLVEVKLGQRQVPAARDSLAAVAAGIDETRTGTPAFQAVITADGPTMTLAPGVVTFPLRALGA
ncbi:DUF4143 domain-containing protein [Actinomyces timonensis]|uniref:DUF4143 domain-containing protein n=1 Tax=Actinomyces timonensis TaxID=1288391 RepID=A0AAU8MYX6_9ACTO